MERSSVSDHQWARMEPHCSSKRTDPGPSGGDNRCFLEAVLWNGRTGSPLTLLGNHQLPADLNSL